MFTFVNVCSLFEQPYLLITLNALITQNVYIKKTKKKLIDVNLSDEASKTYAKQEPNI